MSDQKRLDIHNSSVPVLCQACEARHKGVCGAMTPDELTRLSRHTTIRQHPAKTILVTEEEPVKSYANLLNGVVKLSKTMADGRQQIRDGDRPVFNRAPGAADDLAGPDPLQIYPRRPC